MVDMAKYRHLFAVVHGQFVHEERSETGAGPPAERVKDYETLKELSMKLKVVCSLRYFTYL